MKGIEDILLITEGCKATPGRSINLGFEKVLFRGSVTKAQVDTEQYDNTILITFKDSNNIEITEDNINEISKNPASIVLHCFNTKSAKALRDMLSDLITEVELREKENV